MCYEAVYYIDDFGEDDCLSMLLAGIFLILYLQYQMLEQKFQRFSITENIKSVQNNNIIKNNNFVN